jgi:hypothetical protein
MKRKIAQTTLLLSVAALCISWASAALGTEKCSIANAAGKWEFSLEGTLFVPNPVPGAAVGTASLDATGNATGKEARNVGGGFANETITGSWTVNSDCTGILTANIYESGVLVRVSVLSLVFYDNSTKFRGVQQSLTLPDGTPVPVVISFEGNMLFPDDGH